MTRKVQVVLQDDIDGSEAGSDRAIRLDGTEYEIDLSRRTRPQDCATAWNPGSPPVRADASMARIPEPRSKARERPVKTADIRHWAEENGIPVATHGRMSRDLRSRYEATH